MQFLEIRDTVVILDVFTNYDGSTKRFTRCDHEEGPGLPNTARKVKWGIPSGISWQPQEEEMFILGIQKWCTTTS